MYLQGTAVGSVKFVHVGSQQEKVQSAWTRFTENLDLFTNLHSIHGRTTALVLWLPPRSATPVREKPLHQVQNFSSPRIDIPSIRLSHCALKCAAFFGPLHNLPPIKNGDSKTQSTDGGNDREGGCQFVTNHFTRSWSFSSRPSTAPPRPRRVSNSRAWHAREHKSTPA
jgi:hypothetical protein